MGSGGGGCGNTTFDMPKLTLVLPTGLLTANDTVTNEYSLFTPPQGDAVMFVICTVVLLMGGMVFRARWSAVTTSQQARWRSIILPTSPMSAKLKENCSRVK